MTLSFITEEQESLDSGASGPQTESGCEDQSLYWVQVVAGLPTVSKFTKCQSKVKLKMAVIKFHKEL